MLVVKTWLMVDEAKVLEVVLDKLLEAEELKLLAAVEVEEADELALLAAELVGTTTVGLTDP